MKNQILCFILISVSTIVKCQEIDARYHYVESEKMILDNSLKNYPSIIGHDSNSFYVLKQEYVNFIVRYNHNLELQNESEFLKVDYKLKDRQFNKLVYFHDSLYLFYSEVKFMKSFLYVKTVDKITLEQNGTERLLCEMPHFKGNFPDIHFQLSLLHNKLLVLLQTDALLQKTIKFDFYVFGEGLQLEWEKTDYFQYNDKSPREYAYTVDEEGNVHILALIYQIRLINHMVTDDGMKNEYLVASYLDKGERVIDNRISLDDRFIRGIKLVASENGSFVCAGFFSHLYRFGIKGAFFVTNNTPTKATAPVLYYDFNETMIENIPESNVSEKTDEIYAYHIKDLVYRKNGNIVLCGEQVYEQSYNNVNNIIVVSFNPYGEMLWNRTIDKIQSGFEYVSFNFIAPVTENDVYVMYNEHHKNVLDGANEKRKSFHFSAPSYLVLTRIDNYGVVQSKKFSSRTKKQLIPDPAKTYDMRDGSLVMYASRYRKYKYFKLTLFE